ncbi:MAG: hypothetical protein A2748_01155 [Candidatus Wildermuthbacteria bacterium RIFCSPHIGHO2_01_FULL_45_20]|uniref:Transcobalamin-like C-terminal domain-containing protein n=1 Tax=Candidatus Wildermuthbacteria bacterium RIFCSPHIGHO2_02_FULL_45_25 TaxID=1802450 RepID=A0A1G2R5N1_9BACT|nr:MAG: hypothetical protein A2748_01155 [Candidatus Wildermuthbacteria bacterium RIFCSPHIGHO2_01_FULL_45_20]OHA67868.1 MAG: hypothetical protein A3C04_02950 [Candidatus Wildermuthbacteria bacterium RIFCSPHIGHO2_02_FULL_45_25]
MDQSKKILLIFGIILGIFTTGIITGLLLVDVGYIPVAFGGTHESSQEQDKIVSLDIDYGNGNVQSFADVKLTGDGTVLSALKILEKQYNLPVETREFVGIGTFVEAIHGVHNTNTKYWQFWVNGEYSLVGAGQFQVKNGDEIFWKRTDEKPNTK